MFIVQDQTINIWYKERFLQH